MKKKIQLLFLILFMTGTAFVYINSRKSMWLEVEDGSMWVNLVLDNGEKKLLPWCGEDGGEEVYYFFLPSFVEKRELHVKRNSDVEVRVDGERMAAGSSLCWEEEKRYRFELIDSQTQERLGDYSVEFMQSANLPAVFIETESGDTGYLTADKNNEEAGRIEVVSADKNVEYSDKIQKISGRGNSTWTGYYKKPWSVTLKEAAPLCGMDAGRTWRLLAMAREGSKMNTKLAFDLGNILGMEYNTQAEWVDFYLNNEYVGIYLLCESVSVADGRVNIYDLEEENRVLNKDYEEEELEWKGDMKGYSIESDTLDGGYLLENDAVYYQEKAVGGFITDRGYKFNVREPAHTSFEQVEYIKNYIQQIEDVLLSNIDQYKECIDEESFVQKFLVDEITKNYDAYVTSAYFYKEKGNKLLYAGPLWDYDTTFGAIEDAFWCDPEQLIVENRRAEGMDWFYRLYKQPDFYECIKRTYRKLLPELGRVLEEEIDKYAKHIKASVKMDQMRWTDESCYEGSLVALYHGWESNVDYLKYFFAKRLNYLTSLWDIDYSEFCIPADGTKHEVSFWINGKLIEKQMIEDGSSIVNLPDVKEEGFQGWWQFGPESRIYTEDIPVYEDMRLNAKVENG